MSALRPPRPSHYRERLEAGLCTACGQRPPVDGIKRCKPCREIAREYERERAAVRRQLSLCVRCAEPAAPGRTLCQRHLDAAAAYQRSYA